MFATFNFFAQMKNTVKVYSDSITKALLLFTVAFSMFLFSKKFFLEGQNKNLLLPHALPEPPVTIVNLNGVDLKIPKRINNNWNARCYDTELPCLYELNPKLRSRGTSIKDGFSIR